MTDTEKLFKQECVICGKGDTDRRFMVEGAFQDVHDACWNLKDEPNPPAPAETTASEQLKAWRRPVAWLPPEHENEKLRAENAALRSELDSLRAGKLQVPQNE